MQFQTKFRSIHYLSGITNQDPQSETIQEEESNGRKFSLTRNPRDIIYMLLLSSFGIWILSYFLLKPNIFGELSSMCGPLLTLSGICFIFSSPLNIRKAGSLLSLIGSGIACYMFFTMQELVTSHIYVYPIEMVITALGVALLCLFISISQLCKSF